MTAYRVSSGRVAWQVVDGEAVIIHFESSAYSSLSKSGTYIWNLLASQARGVESVAAQVSARYATPYEQVLPDVRAFIEGLKTERLVVEEKHGQPGTPTDSSAPASETYESPQHTKHGELEKLILSGE